MAKIVQTKEAFKDRFFKLTGSIDLDGHTWRTTDKGFGGFFDVDGGGHVIFNLRIDENTAPKRFAPRSLFPLIGRAHV